MDNKLLIGGAVMNDACLVLFAAKDDESYRPAITLSVSLDGSVATIDTLSFTVSGPDSIRVGDLPLVKIDSDGYPFKYLLSSCTLQAHTIDVSKANWYNDVKIYERAGLTDWRAPKYTYLRKWKGAWWRIVLDTFDLEPYI